MTLNQLECFMVLAQRLNFTQAAEDLFMAQPALSRTIASLETELGVQFFTRNSRSVAMTSAGAAFLKECPHVLDSFHRGMDAARMAQQGFRGQISLGMVRDAFDPDVVDIFREMRRAYPEVLVHLKEYSHSEMVRQFAAGELDAIVDFAHNSQADGVEVIPLRRDCQCAVVSKESTLSKARSLRMEDLRHEEFCTLSRVSSQPGYDFLMRAAAEAGFVPNIVHEASFVPSLLTMVACGLGIATLTDDLEYLAQGRVAFIPLVGVPLSVHCFAWRGDSDNPSLPLLLNIARTRAKN